MIILISRYEGINKFIFRIRQSKYMDEVSTPSPESLLLVTGIKCVIPVLRSLSLDRERVRLENFSQDLQ